MHSIQNSQPDHVNSAYQTLRDVVPAGAGLEFKPRCFVEWCAREETIVGVAARHDAGMIVLGVRSAEGHPASIAPFSQSIAYKVVTEAACLVLIVRGQ